MSDKITTLPAAEPMEIEIDETLSDAKPKLNDTENQNKSSQIEELIKNLVANKSREIALRLDEAAKALSSDISKCNNCKQYFTKPFILELHLQYYPSHRETTSDIIDKITTLPEAELVEKQNDETCSTLFDAKPTQNDSETPIQPSKITRFHDKLVMSLHSDFALCKRCKKIFPKIFQNIISNLL